MEKEFKTRSFTVKEVAHHIPGPNYKGSYDSVIVYVEPELPNKKTQE